MTININSNNLIIPRGSSINTSLSWKEIQEICFTDDPLSVRGQQALMQLKTAAQSNTINLMEIFKECLKNNKLKTAKAFVEQKIIHYQLVIEHDSPRRNGHTPFHLVAFHGQTQLLEMLMENAIEEKLKEMLNQPNEESSITPLHFACKNNHIETALSLIQHGADLNALNSEGISPFDIVLFGKHFALATKIIQFVATSKKLTLDVNWYIDIFTCFNRFNSFSDLEKEVLHLNNARRVAHIWGIKGVVKSVHFTSPLEGYYTTGLFSEGLLFALICFWDLFLKTDPAELHHHQLQDGIAEVFKQNNTLYERGKFKEDKIIEHIKNKKVTIVPVEFFDHLAFLVFSDKYIFKCDRGNIPPGATQFQIEETRDGAIKETIILIQKYRNSVDAREYFLTGIDKTLKLSLIKKFAQKPLQVGTCIWANCKTLFYVISIVLFQKFSLENTDNQLQKWYKSFTAFTRKEMLTSYFTLKSADIDLPLLDMLLNKLKNPQRLKNHFSKSEKNSLIQAVEQRIAKELQAIDTLMTDSESGNQTILSEAEIMDLSD